ncbi:hypothetical protein ACFW04_006720 [Cataglyphis niger]
MSWIRERTLNWFQLLALKIIRTGHVPKHVAFIMDGNRRYANKQKVAGIEGHVRGDKLAEQGVCIRVIGNLSLLSEDMRKLIAEAMIITENNKKATLNLAFAYTSKDEITHAIKDIAEGVKHADILPEDINENLISQCLYTYKSSNPDLLIRTSGEVRFSDFLLWQISNTCIYFTNVLWPEFSLWNLFSAVFYYQRCYSDLQKVVKIQNLEPQVHNDRVSMYLNKLHHERQVMIKNMYQSSVQS